MVLPDVNVLIYAHREDAPEHARYAEWLVELVAEGEPFAVSPIVLSSFLRVVTNRRIFKPPTPMGVAIDFCQSLLRQPGCVVVLPTERHWEILTGLIATAGIQGAMVSDAVLATLAIEHDCELVSTDRDFEEFEGLRWRHPLAS